jgi:hypothetical protein
MAQQYRWFSGREDVQGIYHSAVLDEYLIEAGRPDCSTEPIQTILALIVSGAMPVAGFFFLARAAYADDEETRNAAFSGTMLLFWLAAIWAALCYAASWIARGFMRD